MNRESLLGQLSRDEGVKYEIYLDHLGYATLGIGHLIRESDPEHGLPPGTPVSQAQVDLYFQQDVDTAITECHKLYGKTEFESWPDTVQEVVVNMMFNLGPNRLKKFIHFRSALLQHNWALAAQEGRNSLWYSQVSRRAERLMRRLELV